MNIFRTFWLSVKDLFDELFVLAIVNIIWVLINAPLAIIAGVLLSGGALLPGAIVALLCVVPLAPTTAGLYTVAQRVVEGRAITWRVFFEGLREHAKFSWRVYGLWAAGLMLILINVLFYSNMQSSIGTFLNILFLYFLLVWLTLLIYIGPLMLLQTDRRIRITARNAFLMALGRPIFTLITLIMMGVLCLLSVWLLILPIALTFSFLAVWSFRATTTLIAEAEARRVTLEQKTAASRAQQTEKGRSGQIRPRD